MTFAYKEYEQKENFCLVYEKLKDMLVKENLFLQVIESDRDIALMIATEIAFPDNVNMFCWFHINKNVGAKCKKHVSKDM